jgi:hypothetical protein
MDHLMEANTITSKVKEEDSIAWAYVGMIELNDKDKSMMLETTIPKDTQMDEEEEGTEPSTPRIETSYNDADNTCRKVGST